MTEEPTEEDRAEFDRIASEQEEETFSLIGRCISTWSRTEGFLVEVAAMLMDTGSKKTGLVFYSINNFHTWLSIIEELFAVDPQYMPLRPDWIETSNRLKKLNDTRVRLAHHALDPGIGIEHFVETGFEDISAMFPTLSPRRATAAGGAGAVYSHMGL